MTTGGMVVIPPEDRPTLAERLKARREARGISQSQAARELDVARTAYRLWELEAARPAPDRWRLLAGWLGVSVTSLLLAEGWISMEEGQETQVAEDRFQAVTGESPDLAAGREPGDFFSQAQSFIEQSVERGVVSAEEAGRFRDMFDRIRRGLSDGAPS
jgi:transcriptional regulator with XRE-family HTH domain